MPSETRLAVAAIAALFFSVASFANPITVNGFTKVADGTTPYPNNPGLFLHGPGLYPDGDVGEPPSTSAVSNDGTNVAFMTCAPPPSCFPTAMNFDGVSVDEAVPTVTNTTIDYGVSRDGDNVGILHLVNIFNGPVRPELWEAPTATLLATENTNGENIVVDGSRMAFLAESNSVQSIRVRIGAFGITVASDGTAVPGAPGALLQDFEGPDLSDGAVVFKGTDIFGNFTERGIYTNSDNCPGCTGPGIYKLARTGEAAPMGPGSTWTGFADFPAIDGNQIAFVASGQFSGGADFEGIFLTSDSGTLNIVDFVGLGIAGSDWVDISNGTVAYAVAESEIRLWNGGDTTTVVSASDPLDGKIVSKVRFERDSLSDSSLAFQVEFTDGTEAIYLADFTVNSQSVPIDIQPVAPATALHPHHDGGPGAINGLNDPIEVTVFGQLTSAGDPDNFIASTIDPSSLQFGPGLAAIDPGSTPIFNTDFDSDGIDDARFTFLTGDALVQCSDTSAALLGETNSNNPFDGTDTITTDCGALCHN